MLSCVTFSLTKYFLPKTVYQSQTFLSTFKVKAKTQQNTWKYIVKEKNDQLCVVVHV